MGEEDTFVAIFVLEVICFLLAGRPFSKFTFRLQMLASQGKREMKESALECIPAMPNG